VLKEFAPGEYPVRCCGADCCGIALGSCWFPRAAAAGRAAAAQPAAPRADVGAASAGGSARPRAQPSVLSTAHCRSASSRHWISCSASSSPSPNANSSSIGPVFFSSSPSRPKNTDRASEIEFFYSAWERVSLAGRQATQTEPRAAYPRGAAGAVADGQLAGTFIRGLAHIEDSRTQNSRRPGPFQRRTQPSESPAQAAIVASIRSTSCACAGLLW
jgi:hypothetical protein